MDPPKHKTTTASAPVEVCGGTFTMESMAAAAIRSRSSVVVFRCDLLRSLELEEILIHPPGISKISVRKIGIFGKKRRDMEPFWMDFPTNFRI